MTNASRIALIVLVAAAGAAAGLWMGRERVPAAAPPLERATLFDAPRALPDFALVDHEGRSFGPARLAGGWSILFFGFTHCPDVCPSTLATLAAVRRELADLPPSVQPDVFLVSVDPQRDSPERLAGYVGFFDPSFTGVTGSAADVEALTSALGVAVVRNTPDEQGNYTVDHTASLFLVNPAGALVGIFGTPHATDGIARDYRLIVGASRGHAS